MNGYRNRPQPAKIDSGTPCLRGAATQAADSPSVAWPAGPGMAHPSRGHFSVWPIVRGLLFGIAFWLWAYSGLPGFDL